LNGEELPGFSASANLMRRVVLEQRDPSRTPVGGDATELVTIDEWQASMKVEAMQTHDCRHLPVTRGPHVWDCLSMRDLMKFELRDKDRGIAITCEHTSASA